MSQIKLLLLSNSTLHGQKFLEWAADHVKTFFTKYGVKTVLFVPYAAKDYDEYAETCRVSLGQMGLNVESIHKKLDPVAAVKECEAIYIGGGNTFLLLKTLYENNLIEAIQNAVLVKGVPYMGASAGTNVATKTINTTNDMPICYPPSFDALNLVPFNINPHYIDPDPDSKHMGETREKRIQEYHEQSVCYPVLGLREGSALLVEGNIATLIGKPAKLFQKGKACVSYEPGSDLSFLLNENCSP